MIPRQFLSPKVPGGKSKAILDSMDKNVGQNILCPQIGVSQNITDDKKIDKSLQRGYVEQWKYGRANNQSPKLPPGGDDRQQIAAKEDLLNNRRQNYGREQKEPPERLGYAGENIAILLRQIGFDLVNNGRNNRKQDKQEGAVGNSRKKYPLRPFWRKI